MPTPISGSSLRPYDLFIGALSIFSLIVLGALAVAPSKSSEVQRVLFYADTALALVFLLDFVRSLLRAQDRWRYLRTWGWLDLLSSIPTVSVLRVGRFARIGRLLRIIRAVRAARVLSSTLHEHRRQSVAMSALFLTALLLTVTSAAILYVEDVPQGNIRTAEDALWWAFTTITTVGYGDRYPVTTEGRVVAAVLMLAGVSLFGVLSGLLASWFVSADKDAAMTDGRTEEVALR